MKKIGVILVDHGSRRERSNRGFEEIVEQFAKAYPHYIVEPAHMELAEPTLAQAFAKVTQRGASELIVHPYFLLPGRHSKEDIPNMCEALAKEYPGLKWAVTDPLGYDARILEVVDNRLQETIKSSQG